jgi:predicted alpha/beta-hydrolase family hydrolase
MKIAWDGGEVSAVRDGDSDTVLVLAHGAGGNMHTPQLKAVAEALAARDISVLRFNFPYAEAKKRAPDRTPNLEACWRAIAAEARKGARRLFLGGRSMGGRIASHIVAQGEPADGLVFLAYPLHPPGKPERMRDEHLYGIDAPMLFVQGTRDSFARADLFDAVVKRLPRATVHAIENGDHGHKVSGRAPAAVSAEIANAVADWIA